MKLKNFASAPESSDQSANDEGVDAQVSARAMRSSTEILQPAPTVAEALRLVNATLKGERAFELDVVERAEHVLRTTSNGQASADLVNGLLDLQRLYQEQLLFKRALPVSLKALRLARQLDDKALLAKALTFRGLLGFDGFDLLPAVEALLDALRIGNEINDVGRVVVCCNNLALLMRRLGRNAAALELNKAAFELSREAPASFRNSFGVALIGICDSHLRQRNWAAALDDAQTAQRLLQAHCGTQDAADANCRSHFVCALQNEVTALLYLEDPERAKTALGRLMQFVERHPTPRGVGFQRFATALYQGFVGDIEAAADILQGFDDWPQMRQEALQCLIDIYDRAKQPDKALRVIRQLLEELRTARQSVAASDLAEINLSSADDDNYAIQELLGRSARFEVEAGEAGNKLNAKLAYLFELGVTAELREDEAAYAGEHIYRVGRLCAALAVEVGCGDEMCWLAEIAGRAHDVGKTSIPTNLILKTELLTDGETEILRLHSEDGAALITQLADARLVQVVAAVRHHHEKWNGNGYPGKLAGEDIPMLARIVAICDSFDAMSHTRSFRPARSIAASLAEVERCAGTQFEPRLAGLFVNLVRRLQRTHGDLDEYLGEPGSRSRWARSQPALMRLIDGRRVTL